LTRITEILDLAPIDLLSGMTNEFTSDFPPEIMPDEIKAHALDVELHWVNESGKMAKLTSGITIQPTVHNHPVSYKQSPRLILD
jgi:hypothetical protein